MDGIFFFLSTLKKINKNTGIHSAVTIYLQKESTYFLSCSHQEFTIFEIEFYSEKVQCRSCVLVILIANKCRKKREGKAECQLFDLLSDFPRLLFCVHYLLFFKKLPSVWTAPIKINRRGSTMLSPNTAWKDILLFIFHTVFLSPHDSHMEKLLS